MDCEVDHKLNTFGGYASITHGIDWIRQAKQNYSVDSDLPQFLPESLNHEQHIVYDKIMLTWNENSNQLLIVVAGTAGSGKSYLIQVLRYAISQTLPPRRSINEVLLVLAYTGSAAHNVDGSTIHGMLQMSVGATDEDDMSLARITSL
ncbi:hypothetical protein L211DRAFT_874828 [Terfezia boudieri ATCC MYA-4762]|uniref:ATP-dependent DNA helicase n=1 Tax=Terfezia boudieri ATCC MYA-4762 TaxID=1051890 RepID=A0A3N4L9J8_9PEZI|nr:hypothetical protein L211DRAFT_874828 [Terfezia boudieri ATCC MYA-4762]